MGLTIHYNLRSNTRSPKKARELVARLRSRALDLPFERVDDIIEVSGQACDFYQYDRDHPNRWLLIQAGERVADPDYDGHSHSITPTHVIAFSTWPGHGCEEANVGLCRYPAFLEVSNPIRPGLKRKISTGLGGWCWGSFCKTQYSSNPKCGGVANFLRCHLTVIRMLDHAEELGILKSVNDEGGFWEKRDVPALACEVGEWNTMIAQQVGQFKDLFGSEFQAAITQFPNFEHLEVTGQSKV
jgi:hypothetical protein